MVSAVIGARPSVALKRASLTARPIRPDLEATSETDTVGTKQLAGSAATALIRSSEMHDLSMNYLAASDQDFFASN